MLNSLFDVAGGPLFPLEVNSDSISSQLLQVFREVAMKYGLESKVSLKVSMDAGDGRPLKLSKEHGIIVGDKNDLKTTIEMVCTNATVTNQTAAVFSMNLETHLNFSVQSLVAYPQVAEIFVDNTKVVTDNVGFFPGHDFDVLFNSILQNFANDLNIKYQSGYNLESLNQYLHYLNVFMPNSTVSPFLQDEFLYVGMTMYNDPPTEFRPLDYVEYLEELDELDSFIE